MQLKKATKDDLIELQSICKEIYPIYFGDYWKEGGLEKYLEEQFGTKSLEKDLTNDLIDFYIITFERSPVGFIKINLASSFEGYRKEKTCELEKMYIHPSWKGKGIGKVALKAAVNRMKEYKKSLLFLCVLDSNLSSIAFYENIGFKFYDKIELGEPLFKEEFKGMHRMIIEL